MALLALTASLVAAAVIAVAQWPVMFQPTLTPEVVSVQPTGGEMSCGKGCTCDEALIVMAVQDGAPGNEVDCVTAYAPGAQVELRRHRNDPAQVYVNPVERVSLPVAGAALVAAMGAFLLLVGAVTVAWELLKDTVRSKRQVLKRADRRVAVGMPRPDP